MEDLKTKRQETVTGKNSHRLSKLLVAGGLAAPHGVIVQGREVIMNEGVTVDQFDRNRRDEGVLGFSTRGLTRCESKDGTKSLSAV